MAVDYYREVEKAPCGFEFGQNMEMACSTGSYTSFKTNALTATIHLSGDGEEDCRDSNCQTGTY
jgi:hypothetical protein